LSLLVGLIVFFGTFILSTIGIEHLHLQRIDHEIKEYDWSREVDKHTNRQ
jgi:hypothetical protein